VTFTGANRLDLTGSITGNDHSITKTGAAALWLYAASDFGGVGGGSQFIIEEGSTTEAAVGLWHPNAFGSSAATSVDQILLGNGTAGTDIFGLGNTADGATLYADMLVSGTGTKEFLTYDANMTWDQNATITLDTDLQVVWYNNPTVATFDAQVTGTGGLVKQSNGTLVLTNAANDYQGGTTIQGGTVRGTGYGVFGTGDISITGNGAVLELNGASFGSPVANNVTVNTGVASGTAEVSFAGSTAFELSGTQTIAAAQRMEYNVSAANISVDITGAITGASGEQLIKSGPGTLVLSSNSIDHGADTIIDDGTLLLDGTHTSGSGGTYQVNAAGTFGGVGTTNRDVLMNGGILAPGDDGVIGTLTTGSVDFSTLGSTLTVDIDGANVDLLAIIGDLTLDAGMVLDFNVIADPTQPLYTIATYTGNIGGTSGKFDTHVNTPSGYEVRYRTHSIELALIPEPGTLVMAILGVGGMLGLGWRRTYRMGRPQSQTRQTLGRKA